MYASCRCNTNMGDVEIRVFKYVDLGSWDKVTREIEEHDSMHYDKPAPPVVYAVGLLAYLVSGDLNSARFLYKRLKPEIQNDLDVAAAWRVGKAMWKDDMAGAHKGLEEYSWAANFMTLVVSLQAELRERTVTLLRTVYTNIPVKQVEARLNLSRDDVLKLARSIQWEHDTESDSLLGGRPSSVCAVKGSQGISAVDTVVRNAFFLEQLAQ
eukprot:TRINITY_DN1546_c0_g1_i1.p1 TRINITY_DN1546_c0_g1~~TRINITY_DN1546_c0_g1_i1.p1  ORF type:complete len:211 (+),score=43.12 TRINITY_DN1546_c0_g1_i1:270-902(+)